MASTYEENVAKLRELVKDVNIAMLTTRCADGSLESRPMGTQDVEFDGDLWFLTSRASGMIEDISGDSRVNVAYSAPNKQTYISMSGKASIIKDQDKINELWNEFYKAWFPKGKDDPDVTLLKIEVDKAEYWDNPSGAVVQIFGYLKAITTGGHEHLGENKKLSLV